MRSECKSNKFNPTGFQNNRKTGMGASASILELLQFEMRAWLARMASAERTALTVRAGLGRNIRRVSAISRQGAMPKHRHDSFARTHNALSELDID
jgi:hypothetical protein